MEAKSQRPKDRESAVSALNAAIEATNLAESRTLNIASTKTIFVAVNILLTMIRDAMAHKLDYVELGLFCADACRALDRGTNGKKSDELTQPVHEAINQLTLTVVNIQKKLVKWSRRNVVSRRLHAKNDKEMIATWRLDLGKILQVFDKEFAIDTNATDLAIRHDVATTNTVASGVPNDVVNTQAIVSDGHRNTPKSPGDTRSQDLVTHISAPGQSPPPPSSSTDGIVSDAVKVRSTVSEPEKNVVSTQTMVSDINRTAMNGQGRNNGQNILTQTSTSGESPPPAPRVCFGRDQLIENIVGLAEILTPIALVGPGGIGKTSIALTILHDDRIKQRFGDNRRFIRCDQFTRSCANFLSRLSKVIGAGVTNPKDLSALRSFLSLREGPFLALREIFIVLDNAESILDPQGTDAAEIYAVVEELSQFDNIWLCITSRVSTIPSDCKIFDIPTLSIEAARDTFYNICKNEERPDLVGDILDQLDFHPLSITLLATVAHRNKWGMGRLTREWGIQRTRMLQMKYVTSLAATIELSLASSMFRELGPDARELLGVIAFFPQGVDEDNIGWLFPTVNDGANIFDKFCVLSLTYRSNGYVTMLAPLRDYLSPKDPKSSTLLCTTREQYFTSIVVAINPNEPNFGESKWIRLEDVNVEHLLDVFTTIDGNSDRVWDACSCFMEHLYWHKQRLIVLGPKIEGLPDDHRFKPECLHRLSQLFNMVGNQVESIRLLNCALKLWRERGDDRQVAATLMNLSGANQQMGLHEEGIQSAREALEIIERLGHTTAQAECLITLALSLGQGNQLDAAEEAVFRAIDLLPEKGEQSLLCTSHRVLGEIYISKGETKKAIHHLEVALEIATPFSWHYNLFGIHYPLARAFFDEGNFDDTHAHIERAKSHAVDSPYNLGCAMEMQMRVWYKQGRLEEARSEVLRAIDIFENIGAASDLQQCRECLRVIREELGGPAIPSRPGFIYNPQEIE